MGVNEDGKKSHKRRISEKNEDQRTILYYVYIRKKIIAKNVVREEQGTVKIKRDRERAMSMKK